MRFVSAALLGLLLASPCLADPPGEPGELGEGVIESVEEYRGLKLKRPTPVRWLNRDEMHTFAEFSFANRHGDGLDDEAALRTLGLYTQEISLRDWYVGGRAEGTQGFYLFGEFSVPHPFEVEGPVYLNADLHNYTFITNRLVKAHELTHALEDQHFNWARHEERLPKTAMGRGSKDAALGLSALAEGTATEIGRRVEAEITRGTDAPASQRFSIVWYDGMDYLSGISTFVYGDGHRFVKHLLKQGGWDLVNQAQRDPPQSTEQILHPERYLNRDYPTRVDLPMDRIQRALKKDDTYRPIFSDTLGELGLWALTKNNVQAADGWDGDAVVVLQGKRTGHLVGALVTVWDTEKDALQFAGAELVAENTIVAKSGRMVFVLFNAEDHQVQPLVGALLTSETEEQTPEVVTERIQAAQDEAYKGAASHLPN